MDGRFEKADLQYVSVSNRARAFADSYSKVTTLFLCILHTNFRETMFLKHLLSILQIMFQYMARHSPLKVEDLASMISHENQQDKPLEVEMSD